MSPIVETRFRFSDAHYAIQSTPKSLRKWLNDPDMQLVFSRQERGWRAFSYADLCVLAVMRKLVDFGLNISDANQIATLVLHDRARLLLRYKNTPPEALLAVFRGIVLLVSTMPPDDWNYSLLPLADFGLALQSVAEGAEPIAGLAPSYLVVHMETVLSQAFGRAQESVDASRDAEGEGD